MNDEIEEQLAPLVDTPVNRQTRQEAADLVLVTMKEAHKGELSA